MKVFEDIKLEKTEDGIAKITINRPEVRNAFRPQTIQEMQEAFTICRDSSDIGAIIQTKEIKRFVPAEIRKCVVTEVMSEVMAYPG